MVNVNETRMIKREKPLEVKMKIKMMYWSKWCVLTRQKCVIAFNRTRYSNIRSVNEQNLGMSVANENRLSIMRKTGEECYILQIYSRGMYLNYFHHHQNIERCPIQLEPDR